jgi:hypothetical protein
VYRGVEVTVTEGLQGIFGLVIIAVQLMVAMLKDSIVLVVIMQPGIVLQLLTGMFIKIVVRVLGDVIMMNMLVPGFAGLIIISGSKQFPITSIV